MKTHMNLLAIGVGAAMLAFAGTAAAQSELTAAGAEKAGNKAGDIPAFDGSQQPLPGWSYGKFRGDFWKHKGEKPLFVIDASNVAKYESKLSAGQVALLKTVKGYTMPVYPSHRECGLPEFVNQNTKATAGKSKIGEDGWSLEQAVLPSVPFVAPKSGIEAMWNFLQRYQGVAVDLPAVYTYVSPAAGSTEGILVGAYQLNFFPWAQKGANSTKSDGGLQGAVNYGYTVPAALAGQAVNQRFYYDKDSESFYYFTGQRRVRRLPSYAYDAPLIGFENQYPVDQSFVFFGNPDRFDWKLVGKKEMYVPYNNFAAADFTKPTYDNLKPNFVSPEFRRYELHRVWELVGTVKAGVRHSAPKKTLYLDEDTWTAVVGDDYDAQGKLWRSKESGARPAWEIGACTAIVQQNFYDLISGRYVADGVQTGTGKDFRSFSEVSADPRLKSSFFTAESLRANSER
jgi:hypothetical protein